MKASTRIPFPFWIAMVVAVPLAVLFLLSLAAAAGVVALAGAAYWLLAPRRTAPPSQLRRRSESRNVEIELAPGDYQRLPEERDRG